MTQGDKSPIDLPEDFHLLPFEEKAKYIVELRRRGYTYREIAKMLRVSFRDISMAIKMYGLRQVHHNEFEKLKEKVEELDDGLVEIIEDISKLSKRLEFLERVVGALASMIKGYEEYGIKSKIDKLSTQLESLEREIKTLHAISARHSKEEADLHEGLRKLNSRIDMLSRELEMLNKELLRLREAHSEFERLVCEVLSLLKRYMDNIYEILCAIVEHVDLKIAGEFLKRMTILNAVIKTLMSKLSREER